MFLFCHGIFSRMITRKDPTCEVLLAQNPVAETPVSKKRTRSEMNAEDNDREENQEMSLDPSST